MCKMGLGKIPNLSTQSSWAMQQASRSSHGFSPAQPQYPTPQYLPYLIPIADLSNIPKLIKSIFASTQLIKLIDRLILLSHCSTMHVVLQFPWSEQLTAATRSSRQRRIPNDAAARDMFVGRIKEKEWSMVDLQVSSPASSLLFSSYFNS